MPSLRSFLSITLLAALLSPVLALAPEPPARDQETESDIEAFQKLLDQVDARTLHAALHDYSPKKFKHGMFQEDRNAVKAIHVTEPKIAHSILELAKRQDQGQGNGTVPTSSPAQASTPAPASTSDHVATPVPPIAPGSTIVPASSSSSGEATSSALGSSSFASTPATSRAPSTSVSSIASSAQPTTSAPVSSSLTKGQVTTSTDASGHVIVSTIGGGVQTITPTGPSSNSAAHSSVTSTAVRTTTLADGSQSTITAVTVIQGGANGGPTPTGDAGVSGTKTGRAPGLQTGEAVMSRGFGMEGMAVLIGALGFAAMM